MAYSNKVLDHYENPRNVGSFDKADEQVGTGMVGAPACGDVMKLQIRVNEQGVIEDARFKTYGCGSAIASSSLVTEWVKGKTIDEAEQIKNTAIAEELAHARLDGSRRRVEDLSFHEIAAHRPTRGRLRQRDGLDRGRGLRGRALDRALRDGSRRRPGVGRGAAGRRGSVPRRRRGRRADRARDRDVVVCRYLLDLSEAETAAALDLPKGTVKSRTARALVKLRALLKEGEVRGAGSTG